MAKGTSQVGKDHEVETGCLGSLDVITKVLQMHGGEGKAIWRQKQVCSGSLLTPLNMSRHTATNYSNSLMAA